MSSATVPTADKRRHQRRRAPVMRITLDGHGAFDVTDWSHGGFRLDGMGPDLTVGTRVTGEIVAVGPASPGAFAGEVSWRDGDAIGVRFTDLRRQTYLSLIAMRPGGAGPRADREA